MNSELIAKIAKEYKRHRDYADKLLAPRRAEILAAKKLEAERIAYYEKKKWWDA